MANPLPNEDLIYKKIEEEKIKVDPLVWMLLDHHIRNDLNVISVIWSNFMLNPGWLLKFINAMIKFVYKISGQKGEPDDLIKYIDITLERVKNIDNLLSKLKKATKK